MATGAGPQVEQPSPEIDLSEPRHIHVIGIGGAGMSAIAHVLHDRGHTVSGSDMAESAVTSRLIDMGIDVRIGHDGQNVRSAEIVTHSTAIPPTNPEMEAATAAGMPVLRRAEMLTALTKVWRTIAVAGTHGKTTTSAMLTAAMRGAGLDPAFIVGGNLMDLGSGASVGTGEYLVVEADESDGTFIELHAQTVIVTNVEPDHLEYYGGFEGLEQAFVQFVTQAPGQRVICLDDPGAAALLERLGPEVATVTYGVAAGADWRIVNPIPTPTGISFDVEGPEPTVGAGRQEASIGLLQPGMHNARNATAALATVGALGGDVVAAAGALSAFGGVGRRFERRGQAAGVDFVDDYAHLPTEVRAALAAARSLEPERLVVVFQPHRYSRTEQLWNTFGEAFVDADVLFVTGIYPSGEKPRPGISGELIANIVGEQDSTRDVRYVESLDDLTAAVVPELQPGDLCMTLGAGDLTTMPDAFIAALEERGG